MKKYFYLTTMLIVVSSSVLFYSCRKYQPAMNQTAGLHNSEQLDDLFMKWAQSNNGRWLPYSIRQAKEHNDQAGSDKALQTWAEKLRPVNAVKAYYRNLLGVRLSLSNSDLDNYLDSVYTRRYKTVNQSLQYQNTMDSLYNVYIKLEESQKGKPGAYQAGALTLHFREGTGRKMLMSVKSGTPSAPVSSSPSCIPAELTDWFNQQYDNVYTRLVNGYTPGIFQGPLYSRYNEWLKAYNKDECSRVLFGEFFWYALGTGFSQNNNPVTLNCGQATDSISKGFIDYYSCLHKQLPDALLRALSDGDPLESRYNNVYFSSYKLNGFHQQILGIIHREDQQADAMYNRTQCGGMPNMSGNMFFPGIREHMLIQLHYLAGHVGAEREYVIPQTSSNNPLNPGRADIANPATGEIFEIKPAANPNSINSGIDEVNTYVIKANQFCANSLRGPKTWIKGQNFAPTILPYSALQNLQASLKQPGLIVYDKVPRSGITQPIVLPQSVAEKFKRLVDRLKSFQNFYNQGISETIIVEFLLAPENRELVRYIRPAVVGVGVALIVGTIVEDFVTAGVGISDDLPCFTLAYRIIRIARYY